MANDCDCKVKIVGESENVSKLYQKLQCDEVQNVGSLHLENYQILFDSCDDVEDWGSKWQVFSNIDFSEGDTMMFIDGYSAWGPTEGLWKKISKDFDVNVEVEFSEPGMGFAGFVEYSSGEESSREEMTYWEYLYNNDSEYFWEEIGYRSECNTLDELKEDLGNIYDKFDDLEKSKLEEIHEKNYTE